LGDGADFDTDANADADRLISVYRDNADDCADRDIADAVGPVLADGLTINPKFVFDGDATAGYRMGADVFLGDTLAFTVNEIGRRLLDMADGTVTLEEMVKIFDLEINASEAGMFFVTLSEAGYLKNRVAIKLFERMKFIEECV
jgi:hypothetical protein